MGKTKTEHHSPTHTTGHGKKPFYKTYPFHQSALRVKLHKKRNDFAHSRRTAREDNLRNMDLLRGFYTLTQTSTITKDSIIFRLHTKFTVVVLVTLSIVVTTRQYVGNPIDCIHIRDIPEDVLNTFCWIHSTFTVVDAHNKLITDTEHYPGILFTGNKPIKQLRYYQWIAFVLFFQDNATITVNLHSTTNQIKIKRGVRQGDTISPELFITVLEHAFKMLAWQQKGIVIDGERLNHLRFADDIVIVSDSLGEIKDMLQELNDALHEIGLTINFDKTKIMTNMVPSEHIQIHNNRIEISPQICILGP
ncbi:uncharacterized protein LOC115889402 [Sitophilus oryzae]|uniref:Innexin n=1 Tax=Sitophilus oryzae TaxID=7048 RepID=A0A6J2YPQ2_SITOR|nr:uncharacterized protein LOC115889402 [Sitophilus oryzae]